MAHPFRDAVEAGDLDALVATLAEDVVFNSPVVHAPYAGRDATAVILGAVFGIFEDFRYIGELEGGGWHALRFAARVGDREVEGIDLLREGDDGLVAELTVLVRPLSAALALRDAMGAKLAAG
jgi:hypothetical protein